MLAQKISGKQATLKAKLDGNLVDVKDLITTPREPSIHSIEEYKGELI